MTFSNAETNKSLIVVSRDLRTRRVLAAALHRLGHTVVEQSSAGDVMGAMNNGTMVVVVDVSADVDLGAATVQRLSNIDKDVPVVAVCNTTDAWRAVASVGGYDCVTANADPEQLVMVVQRAVEHRSLLLRVDHLERKYRNLQSAVHDAMDEPPNDLEQQFGEGTDVHEVPTEATAAVVPLRVLEEKAIKHAMQVTNGSVTKAARLLGIGRATLYRRLANNVDRN